MADDLDGHRTHTTDLASARYKKTPSNASDNPLCSTKHFLVAFEPSCPAATFTICYTLFTNCCAWLREAKTFALRSQSVCKQLRMAKNSKIHVPNHPRHSLTS
jgi:hypothetical protein